MDSIVIVAPSKSLRHPCAAPRCVHPCVTCMLRHAACILESPVCCAMLRGPSTPISFCATQVHWARGAGGGRDVGGAVGGVVGGGWVVSEACGEWSAFLV